MGHEIKLPRHSGMAAKGLFCVCKNDIFPGPKLGVNLISNSGKQSVVMKWQQMDLL